MLELYNTTKQIKKIPKYRYNGTYTIAPYKTVDIEEDQAYFFKPYSRVGIVVRCKSDSGAERAEEAEKVVKDKVEETKAEVENITPIEEKKDEVQPEVEVSSTNDVEVSEEKKEDTYTVESFDGMSLSDLKEFAESIGLDASECKRRNHAIELILDSQK